METHSEHLLLRLRRLVAEGQFSPDDVAILYVEKDGATSRVQDVPVDSLGHIEPSRWPAGFFNEGLSESLALAQAQSTRLGSNS